MISGPFFTHRIKKIEAILQTAIRPLRELEVTPPKTDKSPDLMRYFFFEKVPIYQNKKSDLVGTKLSEGLRVPLQNRKSHRI